MYTLNNNLGGVKFGKDGDGNVGYYGADGSLVPFSSLNPDHYINPSLLTMEGITWLGGDESGNGPIKYVSGGIYVKDGWCYIDLTVENTKNQSFWSGWAGATAGEPGVLYFNDINIKGYTQGNACVGLCGQRIPYEVNTSTDNPLYCRAYGFVQSKKTRTELCITGQTYPITKTVRVFGCFPIE